MKTTNLLAVAALLLITVMPSCDHRDHASLEKPFDIKKHFIAGTLISSTGSYYESVYFIKFLEENKALLITSLTDMTANYTLTKDSLIVDVTQPGNERVYKFSLDDKHNITSAYYKSLSMEFKASGILKPVSDSNHLAGKTFKGEEYVMGKKSFRKSLYYKFSSDGKSFGTGLDLAAIDDKAFPYEPLNAIAFKSKSGNTTQLGFLADSLATFRFVSGGLFYFGKYAKQ